MSSQFATLISNARDMLFLVTFWFCFVALFFSILNLTSQKFSFPKSKILQFAEQNVMLVEAISGLLPIPCHGLLLWFCIIQKN